MAQRVLSIRPMPGQDGGGSPFAALEPPQPPLPQQQQAAAAAAWAPDPAAAMQQQQQQQAPSFAASALQGAAATRPAPGQGAPEAPPPPRQAQAGEEGEQHPMTIPVSAVAAGWAPDRAGKAPSGSGEAGGVVCGMPAARAAGDWPGLGCFAAGTCCGSRSPAAMLRVLSCSRPAFPAEVFLDALAEELIAAHVLRFQQQQQMQQQALAAAQRAAAAAQQQAAAQPAQAEQGQPPAAEAPPVQPGEPEPSKGA